MLQRAGGSLAGVEEGGGVGVGEGNLVGWGEEDTSAWHMWLAAGVGPEEPGGRMKGGCDCAGGGG